MNRTFEKFAPTALSLLLLASCGDPANEDRRPVPEPMDLTRPSRVADLIHNPAHTDYVPDTQNCVVAFPVVACTQGSHRQRFPAEWYVTLERCEGQPVARTSEEEVCRDHTLRIGPNQFNALSQDDIVTVEDGRITILPPVTTTE